MYILLLRKHIYRIYLPIASYIIKLKILLKMVLYNIFED